MRATSGTLCIETHTNRNVEDGSPKITRRTSLVVSINLLLIATSLLYSYSIAVLLGDDVEYSLRHYRLRFDSLCCPPQT